MIYVTLGVDDDVNADSDLNYSDRYWQFSDLDHDFDYDGF